GSPELSCRSPPRAAKSRRQKDGGQAYQDHRVAGNFLDQKSGLSLNKPRACSVCLRNGRTYSEISLQPFFGQGTKELDLHFCTLNSSILPRPRNRMITCCALPVPGKLHFERFNWFQIARKL